MGTALALCLAVLLAPAAGAKPVNDQLLVAVARELPSYGFDVDPTTLSRAQLSSIFAIIHSNRSEGDKRSLIRSTLGGRNSLRGVLFGSD